MVKGKHDTVTLSIVELKALFEAGSHFGREHTLLDMDEMEEEDMDNQDFDDFMNLHHAIELI